jgi:hypothetical protein
VVALTKSAVIAVTIRRAYARVVRLVELDGGQTRTASEATTA